MSQRDSVQRAFLYRFLWSLFVVGALVLAAFILARGAAVENYIDHTSDAVRAAGRTAALEAPVSEEATAALAGALHETLGARSVTVFDTNGVVRAHAGAEDRRMERYGLPEEFFQAARRGSGSAVQRAVPDGPVVVNVARLVRSSEGLPVLVVRVSQPRRAVLGGLAEIFLIVTYIGAGLLAVTATYLWRYAGRYATSLGSIVAATEAYARGDLQHRTVVELQQTALSEVARNLNDMAYGISRRVADITSERDELETILSTMIEGVIFLDGTGHIQSVNAAARRLFSAGERDAEGRSIVEFTRNAEIDEFARAALQDATPRERTIAIYSEEIVYLQLHGSALLNADGHPDGVVIVITDVTRIKRLENIRRDFVANVSHELKTPITSVLGFVETLRDGAVEDPERARRFLEIIDDHARRLNEIVDDLLSLSHLESQEQEIERDRVEIGDLVDAVMEASGPHAAQKNVRIYRRCECETEAYVNASLLQQALTNLVDNAVKYSPPGSEVGVEIERTEDELRISVVDNGPGIPRRDLPRIFERFYRVDRARSRSLGGTGLGLSIVKHIAQVHGGSVDVRSELGRGSVFTIRVPDPGVPAVSTETA